MLPTYYIVRVDMHGRHIAISVELQLIIRKVWEADNRNAC